MGIEPTARQFQSCFLIRQTNPFFSEGHVPEKVTAWEWYYIFVKEPVDTPFNFLPCAESLPVKVDSFTLNLDSQVIKLNEFFSGDLFDLKEICSHEPWLAFWGIHPDPLLAKGLDLGDSSSRPFFFLTWYFLLLISQTWWCQTSLSLTKRGPQLDELLCVQRPLWWSLPKQLQTGSWPRPAYLKGFSLG